MFDTLSLLALLLIILVHFHQHHLDAGAAEQVDAVGQAVLLAVDHPFDACLDDKLGALDARRGGDIERRAVAVVRAARELGDGVCLCMQHVRLGHVVVVLADVLESAGRTIVAIADYHLIFHHQGAHLPPLAIAVLGPNLRHTQVALVKLSLFFV